MLVEKRKEDLTECIAYLDSDITKYSTEGEAKRDFALLTKANSFRKTKMEKEKSIKALNVALGKLENDVNNLSE